MARITPDQPLVPSVLDRLLDREPWVERDPPRGNSQVLAELQVSVRRDVENLLNARWRAEGWDPELSEVTNSIVAYGLPDASAANLGSEEGRRQFLKFIEQTVRRFEPRFLEVRIELLENARDLDRTLRFRMHALLRAYPAPEPVVFDSALEPATGKFEVAKAAR